MAISKFIVIFVQRECNNVIIIIIMLYLSPSVLTLFLTKKTIIVC